MRHRSAAQLCQSFAFGFRLFSARVMVKGIPPNWQADEIKSRFGTITGLTEVFVVKNSTG